TLEMLECLTGKPHRESEALWETLSFNAFHDIICGSLVKEAAVEALALYDKAEDRSGKAVAALMGKASGVKTSSKAGGAQLYFNSLPYPRREIVETKPGKFTAVELPACGFAAATPDVRVAPADVVKVGKDGKSLENHYLRVRLGDNGTIVSLYDKVHKQELARPDDGMNNPMAEPDHGDPWMVFQGPINGSLLRNAPVHQPRTPSGLHPDWTGRVGRRAGDADAYAWPTPMVTHRDPLHGAIDVEYKPIQLTTRIMLRAGENMVRFETRFMPRGKKNRLRVAFPTAIAKGVIRHSVPFGHIRRPEGEYAVQGWMDYADKTRGLLLLNRGLPGNNVTDGIMMLSLFRAVSMEQTDKVGWYEEGIEHVFEYAVSPFRPGDASYNPARMAALYNRPVEALSMTRGTWKQPTPPVVLDGDGAELTCLRRDQHGWTARVWESRGRRSAICLTFVDDLASATRTDATGKALASLPVSGRSVKLSLKPFEIVTLTVTLAKG
ncbi:MAG: hypothetical protein IT440_02885, partial [Phycisphaeraceae bacterium]|nr:hypothetical protein [Phycisphaeraceae bacterium]